MREARRGLRPLFILKILLLLTLLRFGYSEAWEAHPYKCFKCEKILLERDGERLRPKVDRERVIFKLTNKSVMNIQICTKCKETLKETEYKDIMQAIRDSWEYEITVLNNWSEEQQQDYRDRFYSLEIIKRIE